MDDQKRRDDGMAKRRKVLGDAWIDKSAANINSFNADFIDLITRHAWADIWTRPHFDERTRRVLVIGTLLALGQWDEFRLHVRAALTETSLAQFVAILANVDALLCGDTLALHVATALGLPTVAVFGPTSPAEIFDFNGLITKVVTGAKGRAR